MSAPPPPDHASISATNATARLFSSPLPLQRHHLHLHQHQQPLLHHPHPNSSLQHHRRLQHHHHQQQQIFAGGNQRPHTNQPQQSQPRNPQIQDPNQGVLYPVASSGRGFLPRPIPIPQHHNSSRPTPAPAPASASYPYQGRPFGVPLSDPLNQAMNLVRPNNSNLHQSVLGSSGASVPNIVKRVPGSTNPKVAPSPSSVPDSNGIKDKRERIKDDNYATIRHRKVKLSEGSSLYSLCRSWMKNSVSEENQPRYAESVKSLPKPLPAQVADVNSEVNKEDEKEEIAEDVENLTSKELLQSHINRAKKVRARLREERLQRIARYKGRLALLLPPVVDQQFKNDSSALAN